jgi:hypothetical protein
MDAHFQRLLALTALDLCEPWRIWRGANHPAEWRAWHGAVRDTTKRHQPCWTSTTVRRRAPLIFWHLLTA